MALNQPNVNGKFVRGIGIVVALLIVFFFLKPFTVVNSGSQGLKFTMGKLNNEVLKEGMRFRWPIVQKIEEISIRPIELDYDVVVGTDGAITKDNQNVGISLKLYYRYIPEELAKMWRDVGEERFQTLAQSAMKEAIKQEVGKFTIFEIAPIQTEIRNATFKQLKLLLAKYPVELTDLRIVNYDWPDTFEKSIEDTMQKAQLVKQKQQDLLVAEQEAQKQVKQAEAERTAMVTRATGRRDAAALDAEGKALEGEGIRKYNASIAANMEQEVRFRQLEIDKIKAGRWNGINVPNNMYGPIPVNMNGGIQGVPDQPHSAVAAK